MPRCYALCEGAELAACSLCRRHVSLHPVEAGQKQQAYVAPAIVGTHCNNFIEQPSSAKAAITPTDTR